jgi:hypothetical protein
MEAKQECTLHYLAATEASGSVARQQKITHAHESPFYHYTQLPHPFVITYPRKNKVGYFLDRPRIKGIQQFERL